MRLKSYMNETVLFEDHINNIKELIQKDCKSYLSVTRNGKYKFYRGMDLKHYDHRRSAGEKFVRQDREPRGMNSNEAENLNKWLEENGHIRRDKAVFATSSIKHTKNFRNFGEPYVIYPIGNFDYTYIKHIDINDYSGKFNSEIEAIRNASAFLDDYDLSGIFVTNKNIATAFNKKYEIWFNCKSYYYLRNDVI